MSAAPPPLMARLRQLPARGVISVACGFFLHLSLGSLYTFGNLTTYLTSYLHVKDGLDVDYGETNWIGTSIALFQGPFVFVGSLAYAKFGGPATMITGCAMLTTAQAVTYFSVGSSFGAVLLTYGALNGAGTGLVYSVPLLVGYRWFPRHRGLVSGIIVGGYGLGGVFFTAIQTSFINPGNLSPAADDGFFHDARLLERVPFVFLLQAGVCAALQIIGLIGIREPLQQAPAAGDTAAADASIAGDGGSNESETDEQHTAAARAGRRPAHQAWYYAFTTLPAWQLLFGYDLNAMGALNINDFWKSFGQTFIADDHFLELVGSVSSIFNLLGRIVWGLVCDKFGYKPAMLCLTTLLAFLLFTWQATAAVSHAGMFAVWVWAMFFAFSGTYAIVITGTAAIFGAERTGPVYGAIFMSASFVSPLASLLVEFILDSCDYSTLFLVLGCTTSLSLLVTMSLREQWTK